MVSAAALPKKDAAVLFVAGARHYASITTQLLNQLVNREGLQGVYIAANRPHHAVRRLLNENSISNESVAIVDLAAKTLGNDKVGNTTVVRSARHLGDALHAVKGHLKAMDGNAFVLLDSLSALALYNRQRTVARFSKELREEAKRHGATYVMLSADAHPEMLAMAGRNADSTIRIA